MAITGDSQYIASGCEDGKIKFWHAEAGECVHTLTDHRGPVMSLDFSSDGKILASGGHDGAVRLWAVTPGGTATLLRAFDSMHPGSQPVMCLKFSPDGQRALSASPDKMIMWEVETGRQVMTWQGWPHLCAAWSHDGEYIAYRGPGKALRVSSAVNGKLMTEPAEKHGGEIMCVAFGTKLSLLVSGGGDKMVFVWELGEGRDSKVRHRLKGPSSGINAVALSPDDWYVCLCVCM